MISSRTPKAIFATVAEALIDQCKKMNDTQAILNAKDDQGSSPLFYAAGGPRAHGNAQVIKLLIDNGVDLTQTLDKSTLVDIAASLANATQIRHLQYSLGSFDRPVPLALVGIDCWFTGFIA